MGRDVLRAGCAARGQYAVSQTTLKRSRSVAVKAVLERIQTISNIWHTLPLVLQYFFVFSYFLYRK